MLNRIDKDIIRVLLKHLDGSLTTNQIALRTKIANLTAKRHLEDLEKEGYVKSEISGKMREYTLKEKKEIPPPRQMKVMGLMTKPPWGKTISAPSKILWSLRYKKKTK